MFRTLFLQGTLFIVMTTIWFHPGFANAGAGQSTKARQAPVKIEKVEPEYESFEDESIPEKIPCPAHAQDSPAPASSPTPTFDKKILAKIIPLINWNEKRVLNPEELAGVEKLLKLGANVDQPDTENGSAPLLFAAQRGDKALLDLLLRYGANPAAASGKGYTALYFAAQGANASVLQEIWSRAPDADILAMFIPLTGQAQRPCLNAQELTTVESLIKLGARVDPFDATSQATPLMFAAHRGDLPLVKLLLKYNADPLAISPKTQGTAFTYAGTNTAVVHELLEQVGR
jgi:ankyrin repeat protein